LGSSGSGAIWVCLGDPPHAAEMTMIDNRRRMSGTLPSGIQRVEPCTYARRAQARVPRIRSEHPTRSELRQARSMLLLECRELTVQNTNNMAAESQPLAEPMEPTRRPWHTEVSQLLSQAASLCV